MDKLTVILHQCGFRSEKVEVSSLDEASQKVTEFQDRHGLGASHVSMAHGRVLKNGVHFASISYNGAIRPRK